MHLLLPEFPTTHSFMTRDEVCIAVAISHGVHGRVAALFSGDPMQLVMDRRDQQILQWLAESSDEEQVGGSDSEPEVDEIAQSDHNSASEIDQSSAQSSESSDNEEDSSARRNKFQRDRDAKDTDVEEIKALLGLLIMSGVLRASHLNFRDLWATDGTGVEIFRLTMRYQRFLFLLRCLRFDDRTTRAERLQIDNLAAIREICDKLLVKYQKPIRRVKMLP
ncbi:hypothetical protein EVAR_21159_1 [Eumeta japonica]|uniref:PiggyBac transposable element-derived protein domain-containing protein n=1 Tax=Eumeta variegata TaxID=151549 RepID=A0A4C1SS37_EUMVA|nr:hypothetical protein EVAR_21159_1 [Eumeta japonica]